MPNEVKVRGGQKHIKQVVEKTTYWCIKKLLPRYRTLDIEVNLKDLQKKEKVFGYCFEEDKNTFTLEIDKNLSLFDLVSTVCHEMVHVKQYAKGEMIDNGWGAVRWKTRQVDTTTTKYMDQPWEIEAFKLQDKLAHECFEEVL